MQRGVFISLEGGEGVGKTTVLDALKAAAQFSSHDFVFTREPGGSARAENLRKILLEGTNSDFMSVETEALIISAARSDHIDNLIMPALDDGKVVICDRYTDSTRAYQGNKIQDCLLDCLASLSTRNLEPDLTILLDADPEILLARRKERGEANDRFEARGLEFHKSVRDAFLEISRKYPERVEVINAAQDPLSVQNEVFALLSRRFQIQFHLHAD